MKIINKKKEFISLLSMLGLSIGSEEPWRIKIKKNDEFILLISILKDTDNITFSIDTEKIKDIFSSLSEKEMEKIKKYFHFYTRTKKRPILIGQVSNDLIIRLLEEIHFWKNLSFQDKLKLLKKYDCKKNKLEIWENYLEKNVLYLTKEDIEKLRTELN